jgi:hypothetical protein
MTPKEKAKDLVYKFWSELEIGFINSKKCALIAVDEILELNDGYDHEYWQEVKQEIEKL